MSSAVVFVTAYAAVTAVVVKKQGQHLFTNQIHARRGPTPFRLVLVIGRRGSNGDLHTRAVAVSQRADKLIAGGVCLLFALSGRWPAGMGSFLLWERHNCSRWTEGSRFSGQN